MNHPMLRLPTEGRTFVFVSGIYRFVIMGNETGGKYAQWELIVPPGNSPPLHIHSREDEAFFVLQGELVFHIGDRRMVAPVGAALNVPIGTSHTFKNETSEEAKLLITISPAGLENFFFEIGVEIEAGSRALPDAQPSIETIIEVSARYGVEILRPNHEHPAERG